MIGLTLLYAAVPDARGWMNDRKDSLIDIVDPPKTVSVAAPQIEASTQGDGHAAADAADLNPLTSWQSSPTDPQATLTMTFGVPVTLKDMIIRNGALDADGDYRFFRRARQVVVIFEYVDNTQKQKQITLADSRIATISGTKVIDGQRVGLGSGSPVKRMQIAVTSTYDAPPDSPVAITEIEFFTEKG